VASVSGKVGAFCNFAFGCVFVYPIYSRISRQFSAEFWR